MINLNQLEKSNPDLASEIERYCRENGIEVPNNGLIPENLLEEMKSSMSKAELKQFEECSKPMAVSSTGEMLPLKQMINLSTLQHENPNLKQ
jgi:hypothetical protein